jgi:RNA recognition motif-containing protein
MGSRLYVGNLSFDTNAETVRTLFAEVGEVTDVHVVTDRETGRSRGFAFVTMGSDAEAARAITALNGTVLEGRALRVNEAEERRRPGGGGGGGGFGGGDRGGGGGGRGGGRGGGGDRGGRRW